MNAEHVASPVSPPWGGRIAARLRAATRSAERAVAGLRAPGTVRAVDARAFESIAHLNAHTLRDIGAPDWLVARAACDLEAQRLRWSEPGAR